MDAYHVAARKALMEWATNELVLPPQPQNSTVKSYQESCTALATKSRPQWNTPKPLWLDILRAVEDRAAASFTKSATSKGTVVASTETKSEAKPKGEEMAIEEEKKDTEEGSEDEGEVKEDDDAETKTTKPQQQTTKATTAAPKRGGINAKRKASTDTSKQQASSGPATKRAATSGRGAGKRTGPRTQRGGGGAGRGNTNKSR